MTGIEVVRFPSQDGLSLEGWWWSVEDFDPEGADISTGVSAEVWAEIWAQRARTTVIFCHGATDTANSPVASFLIQSGYRVFTFDYRGHGNSTMASISNRGMTRDAIAAWEYVRCRADVDSDRIVVVGHSMGASYALAIGAHAWAAKSPIRAVVAGSGFSSWKYAAAGVYPVVGYVLGTADGEEAVDWAGRLGNTPLLLAHAKDDKIVLATNANRLRRAAERGGTPVSTLLLDTGGHLSPYLFDDHFQDGILHFLDGNTGAMQP